MELELGLKITHNRDDLTSTLTEFRITKDPSGPLFVSTETDSKFILIGHLKGLRRENIDVEINEPGNRISISGRKPVQEMVLMGWIMCRKEVEIRAFRKVFRIPDGVVLDKIKAKLNDEKSTLTVMMPKLVKGICGAGIEEVKEEEVDSRRPETVEPVAEKVSGIEKAEEEIQQEPKKSTEMEEIDQVGKREVGPSEPEMDKVVADEVPEKDKIVEASKEETVEKKKEVTDDSGQAFNQESYQGQSEATKEVAGGFPESDYSEETVKEKPEEPKEEISSEMQLGDKRESRTLPNEDERAPERVEESGKEFQEPESISVEEQRHQAVETSQGRAELEPRATIEKAEPKPPIRTEMEQETASVEPQKDSDRSQKKELPPAELTHRKKLPGEREQVQELEEQVHGPENTESTYPGVATPKERLSSPSPEIEEEKIKKENRKVESAKLEESPKQEPQEEVKELTKPGPHQEPEQQENLHPNNLETQVSKDEVHPKEETEENEIKEKETREEIIPEKVDEHRSQELQKQKGLSEEAAQVKKPVTKKSKVRPPLVVAGSALLVSLLVLVIHFIRAKKR